MNTTLNKNSIIAFFLVLVLTALVLIFVTLISSYTPASASACPGVCTHAEHVSMKAFNVSAIATAVVFLFAMKRGK